MCCLNFLCVSALRQRVSGTQVQPWTVLLLLHPWEIRNVVLAAVARGNLCHLVLLRVGPGGEWLWVS